MAASAFLANPPCAQVEAHLTANPPPKHGGLSGTPRCMRTHGRSQLLTKLSKDEGRPHNRGPKRAPLSALPCPSPLDSPAPLSCRKARRTGRHRLVAQSSMAPVQEQESLDQHPMVLDLVAAPPYEQASKDQGDDSKDRSDFDWQHHWYPVALLEDLDPAVPHPFQLLGRGLVLWRDASGAWRAFYDLCPHRLAPLSEGRIDENGTLQCSYHGWAFHGDGRCAVIPQAASQGPEARAAAAPRACATALPTLESQGLLFVWPDPKDPQRAAQASPPRLPPVFEDPRYSTVSIQRDLFYGYDTLMENVSDPSHIDFAHHKVTGRRDRAKPLDFKVEKSGPWGFAGSSSVEPQITSEFLAPCYMVNRIDLKVPLPVLGLQNWEIWICSFNIPMAPGKTRSIVCSARNFARVLMPGPKWWQLYPRWLEHCTSNLIYDGDMIVLQGQEKAFLRSADKGPHADGAKPATYSQLTFTPTSADRFVLEFRNWLRRHGGGEPAWAAGAKDAGPLPSVVLSKREMLDRLSQHTEKCSSCSGALKAIRRLEGALAASTALLLAAATLPPQLPARALLALAALISCGAAAFLKYRLEPKFVFVDYVHAHID